jgi:hypothetical protein
MVMVVVRIMTERTVIIIMMLMTTALSESAQVVMILTYIQEMASLNLDRDTRYPDWSFLWLPHSLQENSEIKFLN